ncbi:MAG: GTP-binding protein [Candidatus Lokiarchaeota archaeon]|nr:GTP-binding protein [Candidatus Lokiarchaeota archaeon]
MKICLLGDGAVGKTSLVYRFIENRFSTDFKSTLGVNLLKRKVQVDDNTVSVQIWDLGGQEAYKKLRKLYLEGSQGGLVVFDKTNQNSFDNLDDWVDSFKQSQEDAPMILIGNKIDLKDQIKVAEKDAKEYAEAHNMSYISTSAKTGEKVDEAFKALIREVIETQ